MKEENTKIEDDINRRQDRYETREEGYRETIDVLQRELRVRKGQEELAHAKNKKNI